MTVISGRDERTLASRRRRTPGWALPEVRWATAATVLFAAASVLQFARGPDWASAVLYAACYAAGGWEPALAGLRALRERSLDVDLLMVVAALGAAAIGQVFEGALLIVIFATSGALEALATQRTADSVRSLLDVAPERANRLCPDGTEEPVPVADLGVGDLIAVRPGELIGADGQVVAGRSEIDQSSVTGESLPVPAGPGDEVFAGTVNGTGALRVRVERPAADSVIARIAAMVQQASATKAPTQLFIERVEQRYSVGVVVATLALFAVPLAFGSALQPTLLRAMTFMIVASPCALVLATMPPLLAAIATAGRHRVLVKSAVVMERLGTATRAVLDKTGTLTEGTPRLVAVCPVPGQDADALLALAAAAETPSEHPLARTVVAHAAQSGITVPAVEDFHAEPGRGVTAVVGQCRVAVSSPSHGEIEPAAAAIVQELQADGCTAVLVTVDGAAAGVLGLTDWVRPGARAAVARLAALTGKPPILLTGDNPAAADRVAIEVGITDVRAGLLPADKAAIVAELQAAGDRVLVIGDGVNDAPSLATAELGVAMGGVGSDLTLQTADAVLVRDELDAVPAVVELSRRARRLVIQNLALAATAIGVLVAWDLTGTLPLPLAVAGHEGSTVLVALNGLRLLRPSAWR
ncbi:MAG: heavy metal translocating P-type ATPase [Pseudonocardiaceae bacterium]